MSIPILSDVIAPNSLWSATVRGRLTRKNRRAQNIGGHMQINVLWSNSLRSWEFGTVPLSLDVWRTLEGLYEVTDAGASGFLAHDPADCIVSRTYGRVIDYQTSDNQYRLVERKTSPGGTRTHDRTITRPDAASFKLYVNNLEEVTYTLDDDTGVLTIPSDPPAVSVSWSGRTYVPVHFENDDIDWDLVVAGAADLRVFAGPRVMLMEVREE
jgi:uncharacterized protein (TIGR02217 family)